jgi:superfamily II RNA helicase
MSDSPQSAPSLPPAPLAPPPGFPDADAAMTRFIAVMAERKMELYPEQEEAILELFGGANVILNTPTGSGKSLVAAAFHYKALCAGRRSVYTCPIKALVNEKFLSLCRDFGPDNVGMMTGDASVNLDAPVLCCTAEILANIALAGGERADAIGAVIMDEFHYYSDASRGTAWQVPLLLMPRARFLLMSATLGPTDFIERELTRVTKAPAVTVRSDRRPVPLNFEYSETPLAERVTDLLTLKKAPVYLVYFTQRDASEAAQALMSLPICSREEKAALATALEGVRFNSPYGKEMKRWLRHGIGVHHAGLLPRYRILVEQLAQKGLLKLICGTDTLGVGINVPIRTVVFTQLFKYDGQKAGILSVRDFRQIAGRAGRKGYDDVGYVIIQAPEHVIENKRAEEKAAGDPKKAKKLVKQKAPDGAVGWDAKTFEKLMTAQPEGLQSRFEVSHGMLLQVLSRDEDGCRVMRQLIAESHETPHRKKALRRRAWQLFRALLDRKIIDWIPPAPSGRKLKVNVELQDDFSLHQALSLYLIDTLPKLDCASPDYPYDVLTLCEAIVENPETILRRQVDVIKTEEVARMKAADIPYDERMEKLELIEHPKPLREFLYDTFNAFAAAHPWVGQENVRPKSIAREMYERYMSFADYIRKYGLQRSEGLLLRHLSQVWKVLAQTVPDDAKTEDVVEMELYFRELIRSIDSSLLEEWERMRNPDFVAAELAADKPARPSNFDITRDVSSFQRLVRTAILGFLQDIAARSWDAALDRLASTGLSDDPDDPARKAAARKLEDAFKPYFDARTRFRLDPEGRAAKHTHFESLDDTPLNARSAWPVAQVLADPESLNDWEATFTIDLAASRLENRPVLAFDSVQEIGTDSEKPSSTQERTELTE